MQCCRSSGPELGTAPALLTAAADMTCGAGSDYISCASCRVPPVESGRAA